MNIKKLFSCKNITTLSMIFTSILNKQNTNVHAYGLNDLNDNKTNLEKFYYFALLWNPKYYYKSNFTIHGLWSQYNKTSYPTYCNGNENTFNETEIYNLENVLNEVWISTYNPCKSLDFWKHEWNKHGTCNWNKWNLQEYFKNTIMTYFYHIDDIDKLCVQGKDCKIPLDTNMQIIDD